MRHLPLSTYFPMLVRTMYQLTENAQKMCQIPNM